MEWTRDRFVISDDTARIDRDVVHRYLRDDSYWSREVPRDVVDRSIDNSLNLGLYDGDAQVGFARLITDRSTFAFLADVFVLPFASRPGARRLVVRDGDRASRSRRASAGSCSAPTTPTGSTRSWASRRSRRPSGSWTSSGPRRRSTPPIRDPRCARRCCPSPLARWTHGERRRCNYTRVISKEACMSGLRNDFEAPFVLVDRCDAFAARPRRARHLHDLWLAPRGAPRRGLPGARRRLAPPTQARRAVR